MSTTDIAPAAIAAHGASCLPAVVLDSYNLEIEDDDGFIGDRANKGAFRDLVDRWRKPLRKAGADPFGDQPTDEIDKDTLDALLSEGDANAAGVVQSAVEDFAQSLRKVILRFLKLKDWQETERLVIGGGFRARRVGELAIGRVAVLLRDDKVAIDLVPIRNDPDEAGLIGTVQLAPSWMFEGRDGILAVDIGGTNIRVGVVMLNLKKARDLSKACVWKFDLWRHADEKLSRDKAVKHLVGMIERLIARARKEDIKLAPFIGIGCPGKIMDDGSIHHGAQNLPGNWESKSFNLPRLLRESIPKIGEHETAVVMHNDAVVQGLSEAPFMRDVERWGVLTIGTGLGNARFTNREPGED